MATTYDGIILGAGHNGLILQAYLGKAGLKTVCGRTPHGRRRRTEPRSRTRAIPASCTTPTPSSSARSPRCRGTATSSSSATARATSSPSSTSRCSPATARALEWWTDIDQNRRRRSPRFSRATPRPAPLARRVRADRGRNPRAGGPRAAAAARRAARAARAQPAPGRRLLEVSALSPLRIRRAGIRASRRSRPGSCSSTACARSICGCRGFGHHIAALLASPAKAQMSRGGSAALARALEAAVRESGGEIRLMTEPAAHPRSKAAGPSAIETAEGERDPRPAVRRLLAQSAADLSRSRRRRVPSRARSASKPQRFQYNLLAPLFALNLDLARAAALPRQRRAAPSWRRRSW